MITWHFFLHGCPDQAADSVTIRMGDRDYDTLALDAPDLLPLPVGFEEAYEQLERLPRMFIEPDGSFVWTGETADRSWQIDGVLTDLGRHLQHVELKGAVPSEQWRQLCRIFSAGGQKLVAQLAQQAIYLPTDQLMQD